MTQEQWVFLHNGQVPVLHLHLPNTKPTKVTLVQGDSLTVTGDRRSLEAIYHSTLGQLELYSINGERIFPIRTWFHFDKFAQDDYFTDGQIMSYTVRYAFR